MHSPLLSYTVSGHDFALRKFRQESEDGDSDSDGDHCNAHIMLTFLTYCAIFYMLGGAVMAKVSTNISLDAELKKQSQELLADLGLDLSTAVTIFLKQTLREQGIPFRIAREQPNDETIKALEEYYEIKEHPEKYKRYSSFREAMDEVLADA